MRSCGNRIDKYFMSLSMEEQPTFLDFLFKFQSLVETLQSMKLYHGDIKVENIMVNARDGSTKFIDFEGGFIDEEVNNDDKLIRRPLKALTAQYAPPELL